MDAIARVRRTDAVAVLQRLRGGAETGLAEVVQRTIAAIIGIGYLVFAVLANRTAAVNPFVDGAWWPWFFSLLPAACGVLLLCAAASGRARTLLVAAVLCGLTGPTIGLVWLVVWNGTSSGGSSLVAQPVMPGVTLHISSLVLVLARRYAWALVCVVVTTTLGTLDVALATRGVVDVDALAQIVWAVTVGIVYVAVTRFLMMTVDRLDREQRRTVSAARADSWHRRRGREEARIDALVHDQIIAVLNALRPGPVDPEVRAYADGVLATLDTWHENETGDPDGVVDERATLQQLRTAVTEYGDRPAIVERLAEEGGEYPQAAVTAVAEAAGEAVRNALRHAGDDADILVVITLQQSAFGVTVVDDGRGFDPAAVLPTRMGVEVGIYERMRQGGGVAVVDSEPGIGTRVRLEWSAS